MGLLRLVQWKQIYGVRTRTRLQISELIKDTGEPLASQIYSRSRISTDSRLETRDSLATRLFGAQLSTGAELCNS